MVILTLIPRKGGGGWGLGVLGTQVYYWWASLKTKFGVWCEWLGIFWRFEFLGVERKSIGVRHSKSFPFNLSIHWRPWGEVVIYAQWEVILWLNSFYFSVNKCKLFILFQFPWYLFDKKYMWLIVIIFYIAWIDTQKLFGCRCTRCWSRM